MLSMGEVASRLGVSLSLAHKLVRSGQIESYQFGRCRRVSERQLHTYLESSLAVRRNEIANRRLKHF
jgi:excisionase family DNA binding protein